MKILLQCNLWMGQADYRYGLITTLSRMKGVTFKHIVLGQHLKKEYLAFEPDVFLSVKGWLPEDIQEQMKYDGCKTIQLFPDDPDRFETVKEHVKEFDHYYTNSIQALRWYHAEGMEKVRVCCFAADEKFIDKIKPDKQFEHDIIFAGKPIAYRHPILNILEGLNVGVYGKGWRPSVHGYTGRFLKDKEYFSALKSCKIGIDFSLSGSKFLNVKSKTFEIAACGAMVIANKFSEMEQYFKYGVEVVGFTSAEDLRKKCEYFLEHEAEREAIAENGHARFLAEHTWVNRIEKVFEECEVKI